MSTKNIVLFGKSGDGKSSVVNLMAGQKFAETSPGTDRCTTHWEEHNIRASNGYTYKMFDTIGLEDPPSQLAVKEYLDGIEDTYRLIMKLKHEGGIDLLLFCVRAGRFTSTIQNNYRLVYEWLCEKKVPIVLVLTGLETEKNMEDWWTRHRYIYDKHGIVVSGHACITAIRLDGRHQRLYEESYHLAWNLVIRHSHDRLRGAYTEDRTWLRGVMQKLRELILRNFKFTQKGKKDITVLTKRCGMSPEVAKELVRRLIP